MSFKYFKIEGLIPLIIILAIFLQPVSDWMVAELSKFEAVSKVIPFIDGLSTIGMITAVLAFINYQGWKWKIFKWLIDIPNLSGRYVGTLDSSYLTNGNRTVKDCVLEIRQTASAIHINAYTGDINTGVMSSKSETMSEQIKKQTSGFFELFYIFSNIPSAVATQLNNHDGTARLMYYPDTKTLDGSYYNQRKNDGVIIVRWESKKPIGRLKR